MNSPRFFIACFLLALGFSSVAQEPPSIYDDKGNLKLPSNYKVSLAAFNAAFGPEDDLIGADPDEKLGEEHMALLAKIKEPERLGRIARARAEAMKRELALRGKSAPEESKKSAENALAKAEAEKDPALAYLRMLRACDAFHVALGDSYKENLKTLDTPKPALPLRDFQACPGEACQLGKALALGVLSAREAPDEKSPVVFKTAAGELVNAIVGMMEIAKPGRAKLNEGLEMGADLPPFRVGDEVFLLSYIGEGFTQIYSKGRLADSGDYKEIEPGETEFWILAQNAKGECGWIRPGDWLARSNESAGIALP